MWSRTLPLQGSSWGVIGEGGHCLWASQRATEECLAQTSKVFLIILLKSHRGGGGRKRQLCAAFLLAQLNAKLLLSAVLKGGTGKTVPKLTSNWFLSSLQAPTHIHRKQRQDKQQWVTVTAKEARAVRPAQLPGGSNSPRKKSLHRLTDDQEGGREGGNATVQAPT